MYFLKDSGTMDFWVFQIAAIIETGRQEYQFMNDTQDNKWDKLLHIKTMGRDDSQSDQYRYPYEPTPYSVLQRLANTGLIRKNNMLLDYGCGKGRVDFFLSYQTRCRCLGVEYDERIYEKVMENKKEAVSKERVSFSLANAEEFQLPEQIDRIYFFNPFSVEILRKVMARIMESYYEHPRQILCFFYKSKQSTTSIFLYGRG